MPVDGVTKPQLRSRLRRLRQTLSIEQQQSAALALAHQVDNLSAWQRATKVAVYLSADSEIGTQHIVALCRQQAKQTFLPVITHHNTLQFAHWESDTVLTTNRYGIAEPDKDARRCPVTELDIIFMPLVGWDKKGGRLGMGGGFYDRSLEGVSGPVLVGLAHASQEVDVIPREAWDICLNFIATDTALHTCQGNESS